MEPTGTLADTIPASPADVTATEIERIDSGAGTLTDMGVVQDAAGNNFEVECHIVGNDGGARVSKRNTAGVLVDFIRVKPSNGRKIDGCAVQISGSDIHIYLTSHSLDVAHYYGKDKYVWVGVATPYPHGVQPIGAPGVYGGPTPPPPPPPSVDPVTQAIADAIRAILHAAVTP